MLAMVLCAGEGTRLRPLTYSLPKPMVPIVNKPTLEHLIGNLKRGGITEIVINLSYLAGSVRSYFGDGTKWGIKIHYSIEKKLLGTAGGTKKAEKFFRNDPGTDFLIVSGDGLTDIDLTKLIEFHREKRSFGTIALKEVDSRFDYGITILNERKEIKKFVEKPLWGDVFSNRVNTGIYLFKKEVFNHIPDGKFYDFGKQVWLELLKKKKPIYGFEFPEFWTDIGNIAEYHRAQKAALDKKVRLQIDGHQIQDKVWVGSGSKIGPQVRLISPCLVGNNCRIKKNSAIGSYTVVGNRVKIGPETVIKNSVLLDEVKVENRVNLDHCIVGKNRTVPKNSCISGGSIFSI